MSSNQLELCFTVIEGSQLERFCIMAITAFGPNNRIIKLTVMGIIFRMTAFAIGLYVIKSQFLDMDLCLQTGVAGLAGYIHMLTGQREFRRIVIEIPGCSPGLCVVAIRTSGDSRSIRKFIAMNVILFMAALAFGIIKFKMIRCRLQTGIPVTAKTGNRLVGTG